ncbi:MAG: KEOPS complex subunit Pcc1 [Candidatus Caldarchaeum sp.]|nr:KEOPS complex subunit Pcc1 [Candidatus Caldarchaeum sp.]MCX8201603.1 KEOPS complex subunit Pcc1 [Candidatus Caldarchaeum sp.]MDW8062656.1 KEOPS complex subunit Pcc1 [Candidatus Caldarchaeum sp.]
MAEAELQFSVMASEEESGIMFNSILPEIASMKSERSKISIERAGGGVLVMTIRAVDLTAMRAAVNTVIRLLNASYQTVEVLKNVG